MFSGGFAMGRVFGVPLYIGWSAALVLGYFALSSPMGAMANGIALALMLFGSVLVHELGHALVARQLGYEPRAIHLHGFGGLCSFERAPKGKQAVFIGLAGPFAGLALGIVSWLVLNLSGASLPAQAAWALQYMVWINIFWSLFNLLPMYPLDGGHVLRDTLALKIPVGRAWRYTRYVGMTLAVLLAVVGYVSGQWFIGIVAVLSFFQLWERD